MKFNNIVDGYRCLMEVFNWSISCYSFLV